jgi:hypothetical protein
VVAEDDVVGFTHDTSSWIVHARYGEPLTPHPDGGAMYPSTEVPAARAAESRRLRARDAG